MTILVARAISVKPGRLEGYQMRTAEDAPIDGHSLALWGEAVFQRRGIWREIHRFAGDSAENPAPGCRIKAILVVRGW